MKSKLSKLLALTIIVALSSCNNKEKEITLDYKYADKEQVISCENVNNKLLNEALYSFEEDITAYYNSGNSITRAYSSFFRTAALGRAPYTNIISRHTANVLDALKQENKLWTNGGANKLNYNHPVFKCIAANLTNNDLKTTLNALIDTNSMSARLFSEPLKGTIGSARNDKYLSLYIALDFYYANLSDLDLTKVNFDKPQTNIDFNKLPPKEIQKEADPHAGHNH